MQQETFNDINEAIVEILEAQDALERIFRNEPKSFRDTECGRSVQETLRKLSQIDLYDPERSEVDGWFDPTIPEPIEAA
jgi:hypothetical protein